MKFFRTDVDNTSITMLIIERLKELVNDPLFQDLVLYAVGLAAVCVVFTR